MKSEWEVVQGDVVGVVTKRMRIPGGWLYRYGGEMMVFVPRGDADFIEGEDGYEAQS